MKAEAKLLRIPGPARHGALADWDQALTMLVGIEVRLNDQVVGTILRAWVLNEWVMVEIELPAGVTSYMLDDPWADSGAKYSMGDR